MPDAEALKEFGIEFNVSLIFGGQIKVSSQLGKGSTFTVRLRAAEPVAMGVANERGDQLAAEAACKRAFKEPSARAAWVSS